MFDVNQDVFALFTFTILSLFFFQHKFQFDDVFPEEFSNNAVYERTIKPFLPFVLKGSVLLRLTLILHLFIYIFLLS